ncbi:MAG: hypothetical protein GAK35_02481 [Herbaspirillum frisingense]|uniref:Uncharacterized protein n=1 Tax=Herbaspirillum frisingense TaxID=92645 RepID=A0A7V8FW14_9BURK|nr:MAG: hypothetical protein GAK35_02481 [Herbaspirillum frisingense]
MQSSDIPGETMRSFGSAMRSHRRPALAGLVLVAIAALAGCATDAPVAHYPVHGTVVRIIDAGSRPAQLAPCLASRVGQMEEGRRFAVIRYRHWASHFTSTVYAEIPDGVTLHAQQDLEIEPARCSRDQLAVIVDNTGE